MREALLAVMIFFLLAVFAVMCNNTVKDFMPDCDCPCKCEQE